MQISVKNQKNAAGGGIMTYLAIWSIFAMAQCVGSIDPMLAAISESYRISASTALYCSTLASLVAGFSGMAAGFVAGKKISYKKVGVIGGVLLIIGGLMPFFAHTFVQMLALRAIFGIGMGALMCMQNPVTTALVPVEKRAKILGIGTFCGFSMQCILQYSGGVLTDIKWNYGFLVHVLLLLPLIIIFFFLPETGKISTTPASDNNARNRTQSGKPNSNFSYSTSPQTSHSEVSPAADKLSPKAVTLCCMWGLSFMLIVPLLIGCSFLSNAIVVSAKWAGFVAVCFSFGCMTGGILFSQIYMIFKHRVMTVCYIIGAIGLFGSAAVRSIILLCIFNYIAGIGMASLQTSMMMVLGLICPASKVGIASSLMVSIQNVLTFCCSMWEEMVGIITGDSLYAPIYIGCAVYLIFAVLLAIKSPFPHKQK